MDKTHALIKILREEAELDTSYEEAGTDDILEMGPGTIYENGVDDGSIMFARHLLNIMNLEITYS